MLTLTQSGVVNVQETKEFNVGGLNIDSQPLKQGSITNPAHPNSTIEKFDSKGVSLSPGKVKVASPVPKGVSGQLTVLKVTNNGTQTQTFSVSSSGGLSTNITSFTLNPQEVQELEVFLTIPKTIEIGEHTDTLLVRVVDGAIEGINILAPFSCTYIIE